MIINLKEYYPTYYAQDYFVDVPDNIGFWMKEFDRLEKRTRAKIAYHKFYFSLNRGDGIENDAIDPPLSAEQEYDKKQTLYHLKLAFKKLTPIQARRIYSHYILGHSYSKIARHENVHESSVRESIRKGLHKLKKYF